MLKSKLFVLFFLTAVLGLSYLNRPEPVSARRIRDETSAAKTETAGGGGAPYNRPIKNSKIKLPNDEKNFFAQDNQYFEEILKHTSGNLPELKATPQEQALGQIVNNHVSVGGMSARQNSEAVPAREVYNDSPEIEALREAAELYDSGTRSSLIPGFKGETVSERLPQLARPQPTVRPTAQPAELQEVTGQARGYTMLYLMHPKARQTVEKQIDAMLRSKVQQLYLGVLVDGTFGIDYDYLQNVIRRIAREKRSLVLTLYFTNGPAMRENGRFISDAPFSEIDPLVFRNSIISDPAIRTRYQDLVRPAVASLQLNRRLNTSNRNYVSVMLEDNLDDSSYIAMRQMTQAIIGNRAVFIRNPCGGTTCPEGSTIDGLGDAIESHTPEDINLLRLEDAFSLDGIGYRLPGETDERIPSFDETKALAITALSRGLKYFALWRFERQGNKIDEMKPVNEREFEVPSEAAIASEIEILRAGLTPVE